jgi:uncharacterized membrane protein YqjE
MEQDVFSKKSGKRAAGDERRGIPNMIEDAVTSSYDDLMTIIEAKIELVRIEITEKIALVASLLILAGILIIAAAYLITTLALLIGELLGHLYLGYLLVSLLFIGSFVFFTKFRPELLKNLIHKILLSANDYRK